MPALLTTSLPPAYQPSKEHKHKHQNTNTGSTRNNLLALLQQWFDFVAATLNLILIPRTSKFRPIHETKSKASFEKSILFCKCTPHHRGVFFRFQKSDKWSKRDFFLLQMVSWLSSDSRACRWQSIIVSVQWDTRGARKKRARNEELWRRPNWGLITRSSRNSAISGSLKHASFPPLLFEWERDEAREKKSKRKREALVDAMGSQVLHGSILSWQTGRCDSSARAKST